MSATQKHLSFLSLKIIGWLITTLVLLLPFLAFFSITVGSYGFSQGLLLSAAVIWLVYALSSRSIGFQLDRTNVLFIIILLLSIVTTIFISPESTAVIFGIKNNIFPLIIFFACQLPFSKNTILRKYLPWLVIIPGLIVSAIAILQSTLISPAFLESIGYNSQTIDPRQIVDGSLGIYRAFSTLGGPNQLGAYLLLPLAFSIIFGIKQKNWWFMASIPFIISGIILSFSRSAWLAAIAVIVLSIYWVLARRQRIVFLLAAAMSLVILATGVFFLASSNKRIQNVVLHGSIIDNQIMGSDQQRILALSNAVKLVTQEPFGHGLGSAGPASFQSSKPIITENWYLQIAFEIGLFGMVLYIIAFASLMYDFFQARPNLLAGALLAATIGILIANAFLHTWADGTISILGFALYGLYKGRSA